MAANSYTVTHHASIRELPADQWNALTHDNFYLSHTWLEVVEADSQPTPSYLTARSVDGRLVGALPVYQLVTPPGNRLSDPAFAVSGTSAANGWYPALLGGARIGYANNIPVSADLPAAEQAAVCRVLLHSLNQRAVADGFRSASLLYLSPAGRAQLTSMSGWPAVFSSATAILEVTWASFQGYLAGLSRHRRANVRADLRRFAQSGLTARPTGLTELVEAAAPLAVNVQRKYGHQSSLARQVRFFGDCAMKLGDDALIFGCFKGSRLIGYALAFRWQDTLYIRSAGFDYDELPRQGEHFMVMYYEPIRYAIEQNLRRIHFGTESFEAKVQRGCALLPLWSAAWLNEPSRPAHSLQLRTVSRTRLRIWDERFADLLGYQPSQVWAGMSVEEQR